MDVQGIKASFYRIRNACMDAHSVIVYLIPLYKARYNYVQCTSDDDTEKPTILHRCLAMRRYRC